MPWSTRVQIALDSARALEYIHEHTVHVYIHRDIKSENILLDNSFHAKVEIVFWILITVSVIMIMIELVAGCRFWIVQAGSSWKFDWFFC